MLYNWAKDLYPISRSLTGKGVRDTLSYLKKILKNLKIKKVKSGKNAMDWKVPLEWKIEDAYIKELSGKKILDLKKNNLHVLGYSQPVNMIIDNKDLQKKIYSVKNLKDAIPYVTSYYKKNWGFCMSENQRKKMNKKKYKIVIKSKLFKGVMNYGELYIPGKLKKEILLSTNICHPSMGNNETSGIVVATALGKWLQKKKMKYSYRILFLPETIGAIYYLSKFKKKMKKNIIAGFNVVCVGNNSRFSFLPSRQGNTLADRASLLYFKLKKIKPIFYDYMHHRGSDERQYCWPGIDLPVCSIMRSKYNEYKEYHTSFDNLKFISQKGLNGSFRTIQGVIKIIENNIKFKSKFNGTGEPYMTKYNLYPTISTKNSYKVASMMNIILLASDGKDIIEMSNTLKIDPKKLSIIINKLIKTKLIGINKHL